MTGNWAEQHDEPTTRLTRLADVAFKAIEAHPEYREGDRLVLFLDEEKESDSTMRVGGMMLHGYEDSAEALTAIFIHMQAIMKARGFRLDIMGMDDEGVIRVEGT